MTEELGRNLIQQGDVALVDKHADGKIWVLMMNRPHCMNSLGDGMAGAMHKIYACLHCLSQKSILCGLEGLK